MSENDLNSRIDVLDEQLKSLARNYVKTNTELDTLQQNFEEVQEIKKNFAANTEEISKIQEQIRMIAPEFHNVRELKELRSQIFAVMALFFGIFAFISVNVGVTKSLLTFVSTEDKTVICIAIGALIVVEVLFFFCLYYFLLVPFLNRVHNREIISNNRYVILFVFIILLALLCIWLAFSNKKLRDNQEDLQHQIEILNNKIIIKDIFSPMIP